MGRLPKFNTENEDPDVNRILGERAVEFFEKSLKIPGILVGKTNVFACWTKVLCAIWWYVSDKPNPSMNSKEFVTENIQKI